MSDPGGMVLQYDPYQNTWSVIRKNQWGWESLGSGESIEDAVRVTAITLGRRIQLAIETA